MYAISFIYNKNNYTIAEIKTRPNISDINKLNEIAKAKGDEWVVVTLSDDTYNILKLYL